MNNEPDISLYLDQMELIKKRIEVVQFLESNPELCLYPGAAIESVYLQFRKILELIAMGSLIVNKEVYLQEYNNLRKDWNANRMFKRLERINPEFYPSPIIHTDVEIFDKKSGFLTKDDFLRLYKECGEIMHTENPFGKKIDYDKYRQQIAKWKGLIMGLLNTHKIKLIDDSNMYIIHMRSAFDNNVRGYTFEKYVQPIT